MSYFNGITIRDGANLDAFSRLRVSTPVTLFESTFRYDLSPLQYEPITSSGSIAHDAANSSADFSISSATGLAAMQSYRWIKYQPGKSQMVFITFVLGTAAADVTRRVGLFNATNSGAVVTIVDGILLEQTGASTVNLRVVNSGTQADETIAQTAWNLDKLDGTGPSGITLDLSKSQILVIDFQWLGVGRVRVGFDIGGSVVYAHQFNHANSVTDVYMQSATLPVRAELTTTANVSATMTFICASVVSEGGQDDVLGYTFSHEFTGTAGSNADVHIGSLRPFTTFNSIAPRYPIVLLSLDGLVTGNNPVIFKVVYGATFSAGPTWAAAAYSVYSGAQITTAGGTIATSPIVAFQLYAAATNQNKTSFARDISNLYPLNLDAAGVQRALGTVSFYAYGVGGTSDCRITVAWKESR